MTDKRELALAYDEAAQLVADLKNTLRIVSQAARREKPKNRFEWFDYMQAVANLNTLSDSMDKLRAVMARTTFN